MIGVYGVCVAVIYIVVGVAGYVGDVGRGVDVCGCWC